MEEVLETKLQISNQNKIINERFRYESIVKYPDILKYRNVIILKYNCSLKIYINYTCV